MKNWLSAVALVAMALLPAESRAEIQTETFYNPKVLKKRVDWCLEPGKCGKVAAVEYCKTVGYGGVKSFASDPVDVPTIYLGTGETCQPGNDCEALTKVVCTRDTKFVLIQPKSGSVLKGLADAVGESANEDDADANEEPEDPGAPNVLNKLGGEVQGELSSARFADGNKVRVAVFGRGMDSALWWQAGDTHGKWFGWKQIGGQMKLSPSCTSHKSRVQCIVVGSDDGLWVAGTQPNNVSAWTGFTNISGKTKYSPALVSAGNDGLWAFVRGLDGQLFYNGFVEDDETELSNWTGWKPTGKYIDGAPTCIRVKSGHINCYYRDKNKAVREVENVLGGGKTRVLEIETEKRPGILLGTSGSDIKLLVRGLDGNLWIKRKDAAGQWGQSVQKDYQFTGQPVCHSMNNGGDSWCFAVAGDKSVWAQNLPSSAFSVK